MRDALRLSVTSTTATKSNKAADLASLGRQQFVPTKCESPISPFSVPSAAEARNERIDDTPWSGSPAAKFLGVSPQTVYVWIGRKQIPDLRVSETHDCQIYY